MVGTLVRLTLGVFLVSATVASAAPREGWESSLVTNRGAESGTLAAWEGSGFSVADYGALDLPPLSFAEGSSAGAELFEASSPGAALSQTMSVASLPEVTVGGLLGGAGAGDMQEAVVFLDTTGTALGPPVVIGPPTIEDRQGASTLLECSTRVPVPAEATSAKVTLTANGLPAFADEIYLSSVPIGFAEPEVWVGSDRIVRQEAQGPHCWLERAVPGGEPPIFPTPSTTAPPPVGRIEGTVYRGHKPASRWRVVLGKQRASLAKDAKTTTRTGAHGRFLLAVNPGRYRIAAKRPNGTVCGATEITVRAAKASQVKLRCS